MQFSDGILVRIIQESLGYGATLKLFSSPPPSTCSDPDPEICLCEIELPDTPVVKANGGVEIAEKWIGKGNVAAGRGRLCRSFRLAANDGEVICQGSVGAPEDTDADLRLGNPAVSEGMKVVISKFTITPRWTD
jgi:hypothetical protein